jgi:phosphoribosylamine--glycine ligase
MMNVLVVGSGGREHALCWKIRESKLVDKLFCAPGNAGISQVAECVNLGVDKLEELADFALANNVELTVIGPEAPLCDGIVDVFSRKGLKVFGPDKYAAQLEGSKDFAKQFMLKYDIPTAKAATFTDFESAKKYIEGEYANGETSIVIKADGLAAGKGVLVAESMADAIDFTKAPTEDARFYKGEFEVDEACDTFLYLDNFKKGFVTVNGFNLGRYWEIGPQRSLYVPASILKNGKNEIIVFESDGIKGEPCVEFKDFPTLQ